MNIFIIEDEPKTAANLKKVLLEIDPEATVTAIADCIESSVEYLKTNAMPDLIFMDIQLADGLSFEIFNRVNITSPVVFVTAFDEYAVKAFSVNSIDYILKPFDKQSVEKAFLKYKSLKKHFGEYIGEQQELIKLLKNISNAGKSSFLISAGGKYFSVLLKDIAVFILENGLSYIVTFTGKKYPLDLTLDEIEESLNNPKFYRANRQALVNFEAIVEVQNFIHRKLVLKLKVQLKEKIIISKAKASEFLKWMESC